jgi:glyoxylase-like metal-dependent hydrolase (beta-lactamase superfamily II)
MRIVAEEVTNGIVMFHGKISRNLLLEPMVSSVYFLEKDDEAIVFDPSCGRWIAKQVEAHILKRKKQGAEWNRSILIAGHSHMDHANNFRLIDSMGTAESHVYVHEMGFRDGRVMNRPFTFMKQMLLDSKKYFNPYRGYPFPYSMLMVPFILLNTLLPPVARTAFSIVGALPWPKPRNGHVEPESLRANDLEDIELGGIVIKGWRIGDKIVLPTPGHSPCSISLLWPEKKAVFTSDADWIGNPVFVTSSLHDGVSSLETLKELTKAGIVDMYLPAHERVKQGQSEILDHLDSRILRLISMKNEVLAAYRTSQEKNVLKLSKLLIRESSLFKSLKLDHYPRSVVFVQSIVAVCLKEEGVIV